MFFPDGRTVVALGTLAEIRDFYSDELRGRQPITSEQLRRLEPGRYRDFGAPIS